MTMTAPTASTTTQNTELRFPVKFKQYAAVMLKSMSAEGWEDILGVTPQPKRPAPKQEQPQAQPQAPSARTTGARKPSRVSKPKKSEEQKQEEVENLYEDAAKTVEGQDDDEIKAGSSKKVDTSEFAEDDQDEEVNTLDAMANMGMGIEDLLVLGDEDFSKYSDRGRAAMSFLRLHLHLWTLAYNILTEGFTIDKNDEDQGKMIQDLKDDLEGIKNYKIDGKPVLDSLMGDVDAVANLFAVNKGGKTVKPTSFSQVYDNLFAYRFAKPSPDPDEEGLYTSAFLDRITEIFKVLDTRLQVKTKSSALFSALFGPMNYRYLRACRTVYNLSILGEDTGIVPKTQAKKALAVSQDEYERVFAVYQAKLAGNVSNAIDAVFARYAYNMENPNSVSDPGSEEPLKQITVKQRIGNLIKKWVDWTNRSKNDMSSMDDVEFDEDVIKKMQSGSLSFHDMSFRSTMTSFNNLCTHLIKTYKETLENPLLTKENRKKYETILSAIEQAKKQLRTLRATHKKIYMTELRRYVIHNLFNAPEDGEYDPDEPVKTVDYGEAYAHLVNLPNIQDMYGPLPYKFANKSDRWDKSKASSIGTLDDKTKKATGLYARIDASGRYYTGLYYDGNGNRYGNRILNASFSHPDTVVIMNGAYDYENDKAYPFRVIPPDSTTVKRKYTVPASSLNKRKRFKNMQEDFFYEVERDPMDKSKFIVNESKFRRGWLGTMGSFFRRQQPRKGLHPELSHLRENPNISGDWWKHLQAAIICELIYQTSMRIGHNSAKSGGVQTFGACTLQRKHVSFKLGRGANNTIQVLGAFIDYPGKGTSKGPVQHDHFIGNIAENGSDANEKHTMSKSHVSKISQLSIGTTGSEDLAVFLYLFYVFWKFSYVGTSQVASSRNQIDIDTLFTLKNHPNARLFTSFEAAKGKSADPSGKKQIDDKAVGKFMKDILGMKSTAHNLRRFRGTQLAMEYLFNVKNIGDVPNPLLNRELLEKNPATGKPRSSAEKEKAIRQYCFTEVGNIVAEQLGHFKTNKADLNKSRETNATTSINNYMQPIIFDRYYEALGIKTRPAWLEGLLKNLLTEAD